MSASEFQIELPEEGALTKGDVVVHADYGPMLVDELRVGPNYKRVTLASELGPEALQLTGEELRDAWGETLAGDPAVLHNGETRYTHDTITIEGVNIDVSLTVEGKPEPAAEAVDAHIVDAAARGLEAIRDGKPPSECEGAYEIDWDTILDNIDRDATLADFEDGDSE